MIVLPNREEFIKDNFFELSFKNQTPNYEIFKTLNSTELHFLADIYNWDDGIEVLDWILDSNKCDKGTASMIFWRSSPDYYFEKPENEIEEHEKETFNLLKKIIQKFKDNKFRRSSLKYNPNEDFDIEYYQESIKNWKIPQEITKSTNGIKAIYLGTYLKYLKNQFKKKKKESDENNKTCS